MQQYEISNFARPGRECRHNLHYWRNDPYYGFGCGAVAYLDGARRMNLKSPARYADAVETGGDLTFTSETLTREETMAETMMLGLRLTQEGVDCARFAARFGVDPRTHYACDVEKFDAAWPAGTRGRQPATHPAGRLPRQRGHDGIRLSGEALLNLPEPTFNGWQATVVRLRSLILSALAATRTGHGSVAERRLERAREEVARLGLMMDRSGAGRTDRPSRGWDTAANRWYAAKLRDAWEAALAVDRERYGEDVGTEGPARVIEILLREVEDEMRGPAWEPFE